MNDLDYSTHLIRRTNLVTSRTKYSYSLRNEQMITCTIHGDRPAYHFQLPGFISVRELCESCLWNELPEFALAEAVPVAAMTEKAVPSPFYMCSYKDCKEEADYHDMCTFCRDYFCPKHLDKNDCCPTCLAEIGGEHAYDSTCNSMRGLVAKVA